jgi:hypothetical protein
MDPVWTVKLLARPRLGFNQKQSETGLKPFFPFILFSPSALLVRLDL